MRRVYQAILLVIPLLIVTSSPSEASVGRILSRTKADLGRALLVAVRKGNYSRLAGLTNHRYRSQPFMRFYEYIV